MLLAVRARRRHSRARRRPLAVCCGAMASTGAAAGASTGAAAGAPRGSVLRDFLRHQVDLLGEPLAERDLVVGGTAGAPLPPSVVSAIVKRSTARLRAVPADGADGAAPKRTAGSGKRATDS